MAVKRKTTRRSTSFKSRFKKSPITAVVNEGAKLGVPKVVTKFAILGASLGLLAPRVSAEADRIPFMNIFTQAGRNLRARFTSMTGRK